VLLTPERAPRGNGPGSPPTQAVTMSDSGAKSCVWRRAGPNIADHLAAVSVLA